MDLWDLTKVMLRRWYVTVPVALLAIAAAGWITATTGPDYQARGHIAVIPPEVQRVAEAGEPLRASPWNEEALAHAAQIRLEAIRLQDDPASRGYHGEWTVEITGRLPVISVEVVAPTAEQALGTLHRLQAVVEDEVRTLQVEQQVPEQERVRTVVYDTGESVDTSASGLRRALVAALGAGALLTIAVVLGFDAVTRARRRNDPVDPPGLQQASAPVVTTTPNGASGEPVPDLAAGSPAADGDRTRADTERATHR